MSEKKTHKKSAEKTGDDTRDLLAQLQKKTKEQSALLNIDEGRLDHLIEEVTTAESVGGLLVLHASIAKEVGLSPREAPKALEHVIAKNRAKTLGIFLEEINPHNRKTPDDRAQCFLKNIIERYERVLTIDRSATLENALARFAHIAIPGYEFSRLLHGKEWDEVDPRTLMAHMVFRQETLDGPLTENESVLQFLKELHPSLTDNTKGKAFLTFCMTHCRAKTLSINFNRNDLPHEAARVPDAENFALALRTLAQKLHGEWKELLMQCGFKGTYGFLARDEETGAYILDAQWEIDEKEELSKALSTMSVAEALHLYVHICRIRGKTGTIPQKISDADPVAAFRLMTKLLHIKIRDDASVHRARGILDKYFRTFDDLPLPTESKRLWRSYADLVKEKTWEEYFAWNDSVLVRPLLDTLKAFIDQPWWQQTLEELGIGILGTYLLYRRKLAMLRAIRDLPSNPDQLVDLAIRLKIPQDCLRAIGENTEIMDAIDNVIDGVEGGMSPMDRVRVFTHAHAAKDIVKIFRRMFPDHRAYLAYQSSPFPGPSLAEIVVAAQKGQINRNGEMAWRERTFHLFGRKP